MSLPRDLIPAPGLPRAALSLWRACKEDTGLWRRLLQGVSRNKLTASLPALMDMCPQLERVLPRPCLVVARQPLCGCLERGTLAYQVGPEVHVWDLELGKVILTVPCTTLVQSLTAWRTGFLAITQQGLYLCEGGALLPIVLGQIDATARTDAGVVLYSLGGIVHALVDGVPTFRMNTGHTYSLHSAGDYLVAHHTSGLTLQNLATAACVELAHGQCLQARLSNDGTRVVSTWDRYRRMTLDVHDTASGACIRSLDLALGSYPRAPTFCGARVMVQHLGSLVVWDVEEQTVTVHPNIHAHALGAGEGGRIWMLEDGDGVTLQQARLFFPGVYRLYSLLI